MPEFTEDDAYAVIGWSVGSLIVGLGLIVLNHALWVRLGTQEALAAYGIELLILLTILAIVFNKKSHTTKHRHNEKKKVAEVDPMNINREWNVDNWDGWRG